MDYFNTIMEEVWPFVDKGVCRLIKEVATPVLNQQLKYFKVPIKGIAFKQASMYMAWSI